MELNISFYLLDLWKNDKGASEDSIRRLEEQVGFKLPIDYVNLMMEFNGLEGAIGENSWLCLFAIEDLIPINKNYDLLMQEIPEYFLFGKDAADTGYAFHKLNQSFHSFGLMSNFNTDPI